MTDGVKREGAPPSSQRQANFLLVFSPFHLLIARAIISRLGLTRPIVVLFHRPGSASNWSDRERLMRQSPGSEFHDLVWSKNPRDKFSTLVRLARLLRRETAASPPRVFVPNPRMFVMRFAAGLGRAEISTFDDGLGNLIEGGILNRDERWWTRLLSRLLGRRYTYRHFLEGNALHYTVYRHPNVFSRTEYLELKSLEGIGDDVIASRETRDHHVADRVLLGAVFAEDGLMAREHELALYRWIHESLGVSHVIPHPRSTGTTLEALGFELLRIGCSAEEWVLSHPDHASLTIYGIYSTALPNLAVLCPGLNVVNIEAPIAGDDTAILELMRSVGITSISPEDDTHRAGT